MTWLPHVCANTFRYCHGYRSFHKLQGAEAAYGRWMRRILIRVCLQMQQQRPRHLPLDERIGRADWEAHIDPEEMALQSQDATCLWQRVNRLEEYQRRVVLLRYLADLSQEEVA
ncbi:MAG: RNA polymerase sigma factor [Bacillota bacterium]